MYLRITSRETLPTALAEIPAPDASVNYLRYCRLSREAKAGGNESPADGVHHPVLQALSWTPRMYQSELYHRCAPYVRGVEVAAHVDCDRFQRSSSAGLPVAQRFSRSVRVPVPYETQTVTMYVVHHNSSCLR